MPEIKLQHVISCSSEDKNYSSENLLKGDGFQKWRGSTAGEKQVSVTMQFEKASKIHQIDIGNDGSAFIEVLVGKSSSAGDDFQVILVASAFMSPLDSRAGKNISSVRMFTVDKLSKVAADEKWDKVKVVCTQPFNKTIQYGLAFIKFHSPPGEGSTSTVPATQSKLGAFKLKSDEGDSIKTGSLFFNRDKEHVTPTPLTGAAAVRAASKLAEEAQRSVAMDTTEAKNPTTPRDTSQVKRKHDSSDAPTSSKRHSTETRKHSDDHMPPLRKQSTSLSSIASSLSGSKVKDTQSTLKKTKSETHKASGEVAFNKLMRKVVFVMSGYQNPDRAKIRDKAMEMGAEYRPDWGKGCTHLICAFESTPKYNQVKGKGYIVDKDWIRGSYKAKQLLPWRKFRVGRARSPVGGSSGSETDDDVAVTKPSKDKPTKSPARQHSREAGTSKSPIKQQVSNPYGGDTESESGDDTEDEIRRVREAEKNPSPQKHHPKNSPRQNDDIYDASTDDEMENGTENGVTIATDDPELPELPNIFRGKKFFFYGKFDQPVRRKILRFIIAYNGGVEDYVTDKVDYILTDSDWDDNFDQALSDHPSLAFIRPDWIYSCDEHQKYMPHQKYAVIPK